MGLISKTITTKWNAKTKKYYEEKGYVYTKMGDEFEVNVSDLKDNSHEYVKFECDYCGKVFDRKWVYHQRNIKRSSTISKICCDGCIGLKEKESNLKNFGVIHKNCLEETKEKAKQTCLDKYGCENYAKTDEFKEQYKNIMQEKYGVDSAFQSEEVKEKIKETLMEKYGVEHNSQTEEFKQHYKETMMERYGEDATFKIPKFYKKYKDTMVKKYGTEHALQNVDILNNMQEQIKEKYGVNNISQLNEIKNKKAETFYKNGSIATSNQQRYLHSLLGGELNYSEDTPSLDIAFPNEKIYIEYNGSGHDLSVKLGNINQDEFDNKERRRYYFLKKLGWKGIFINSLVDYLPTDEVLINEINKAKEWLKQSNNKGHSHYNIDIGDKINDKKYGHLRRIKEEDLDKFEEAI
jgi:hypothetical protein